MISFTVLYIWCLGIWGNFSYWLVVDYSDSRPFNSESKYIWHIKGSTGPSCLDFAVNTVVCGSNYMLPPNYLSRSISSWHNTISKKSAGNWEHWSITFSCYSTCFFTSSDCLISAFFPMGRPETNGVTGESDWLSFLIPCSTDIYGVVIPTQQCVFIQYREYDCVSQAYVFLW